MKRKAIAALAFLSAPQAHADQYDFVSVLDNNGIFYSSISDMIDIGKAVCTSVRRTGGLAGAANGLQMAGYTSDLEKGTIVSAAANTMCPDIWPRSTLLLGQRSSHPHHRRRMVNRSVGKGSIGHIECCASVTHRLASKTLVRVHRAVGEGELDRLRW